MTTTERRTRERRQRHELIVATARELAEQEGWEAVTTRRLAERVEYSQPVLYSHFTNKDAIVRAVAIEGFAELGAGLRRARLAAPAAAAAVRAVAEAYLNFAATRPALYDSMFSMPTDIRFASGDLTPQPLRDAFAEFVEAVAPMAAGRDVEICAEVIWSALHGLATLTRRGRLPAHRQPDRLDVLLGQLASTGEAGGGVIRVIRPRRPRYRRHRPAAAQAPSRGFPLPGGFPRGVTFRVDGVHPGFADPAADERPAPGDHRGALTTLVAATLSATFAVFSGVSLPRAVRAQPDPRERYRAGGQRPGRRRPDRRVHRPAPAADPRSPWRAPRSPSTPRSGPIRSASWAAQARHHRPVRAVTRPMPRRPRWAGSRRTRSWWPAAGRVPCAPGSRSRPRCLPRRGAAARPGR